MTGTLIATTKNADVHALAYKGIRAWERFPQLRDAIARKFGDEYVLFFARPVENSAAGEMDWYTPVQGEAQSVADLPEAAREAACEKVRHMAADVQAYADELAASPDPLKVTRGHLLRLALLYPDESCIYVSGEQPVIVCWGFGPGTPGVEPKNLTRIAAPKAAPVAEAAPVEKAAPVAEAAPPGEAPKRVPAAPMYWGWLWWLLPLAALCLLLLLLFTSFGNLPPLGGYELLSGPRLFDAPADRSAEIARLEGEIAGLHDRALRHAALCKPAAPEAGPAAQAAPLAESGTVPGAPVAPLAEAPREDLAIPERAEDTGFLRGEWLCRTGLANARTREPVEFAFEFGPDGRGKATVFEKGDRCAGEARASIVNGELLINVGPQRCAKSGAAYSELEIICRGAGADTQCSGKHKGGGSWDANFQKVR